jgi:Phage tail lysozyme
VGSGASAHRKTRKVRKTGRHSAPWIAQKTTKRFGLAAPAVVALGAVAAWQLNAFAATPDADGSITHAAGAARVLEPPVTGAAEPAGAGARGLTVPGQHASPRPTLKSVPRQAAARPAARHHAVAAATATPAAHPALTCTVSSGAGGYSGYLPANYGAIVIFLTANGYTPMAAAGMAGNMYQESRGNPESVGTGGGGLIGWTPLPAGFVTGNVTADLQTQLTAVLTYNQQWAQYIPALNAATSPTAAADVYMDYFERPGIPAAYNREGAASAVAQACGIA